MSNLKKQDILVAIIILSIALFMLLYECSAYARDYSSWLDSCREYKSEVQSILLNEGLSSDYYYLMVAESRCKKNAISKKGAAGFWQLMPATGKTYGCNDLYDLECATRAAARYIKSLESRFNTFDEVIIAYNMGGHNYTKYGKSAQALGLVRRVRMIKKADK